MVRIDPIVGGSQPSSIQKRMREPDGRQFVEYAVVLLWLAAVHALALLGWPIAAAAFPRWTDRGAAFGLPVALLVLGIVAYWVGRVAFGTPALVAGLAVLLAGSWLAVTRTSVAVEPRRYLDVGAVFTGAFLLLVAVRSIDPVIATLPLSAGEKFLDFGLLQSLLLAETLPPEDMWFAGEPVQYYYGGHLIAALLTMLTGVEAAIAYNLSLATFYAALVTAAYGLAGAIAESNGHSRVRAGAFAAFFVGLASNASTPVRFLYWLLPDSLVGWLAIEADSLATGPDGFFYWPASRVIDGAITEFPLFAFYNGDLHAHMMGTPFLLTAAALLFAYVRTPTEQLWRRRLLVFGAVPPIGGLLAVINTWSFPSVAGLAMLAVALGAASPRSLLPESIAASLPADLGRLGRESERLVLGVGAGVVVAVLGVLWTLPFFLGTASGREIGVFPGRSGLTELLLVHGGFLLVFGAYLLGRTPEVRTIGPAELLAAWLLSIVLTTVAGAPVLGVILPALLLGWLLLRHADEPVVGAADGSDGSDDSNGAAAVVDGVGYETLLLVAGTGLVVIVEFAYVVEQAGPERLNTVFKTYMQVWLLWGVAAGAMLAALIERPGFPTIGLAVRHRRTIAVVGAVALVASLSLYGAFLLTGHFENADAETLDGTAYLDDHYPSEAEAIEWLDERDGKPTIASLPSRDGCYSYYWGERECGGTIYSGGNAPSSLTGVSTVAGWDHQVGYRGEGPYYDRVDDVDTIFAGPDEERVELLVEYDVEYVYVGPAERHYYDDPDSVGDLVGVEVAHESGDVTIYEVG